MPQPTNASPPSWRQLTELLAAAIGLPVAFDGLKYRDGLGCVFDPARDDAEAACLAVDRGLTVRALPGSTVSSFRHNGAELMIAEYDSANNGDPMKSFRLSICRAVLEQARLVK